MPRRLTEYGGHDIHIQRKRRTKKWIRTNKKQQQQQQQQQNEESRPPVGDVADNTERATGTWYE